ncbi:response regulator [Tritonibacter horizontis]|nr:response regulator [Tritonibacter horizontis]
MNILLVEDDDLDATMIKRALKKVAPGTVLTRATDGIEAMEMISSGAIASPFFVLLDINMPRMNGHEFLRELRGNSNASDNMVFMFTTSDSEKDISRAYGERVNGYIVKPQSADSMNEIIETLQGYWTACEPPLDLA